MKDKREKFARFGIATKGFVYCLIGILAAMTALGLGGKKTGSSGALEFLTGQPIGVALLILTSAGLTGYVFWRIYQALADPEGRGNDVKGLAVRTGLFFSGLFYGFLAVTAGAMALGLASGNNGGKESLVAWLLTQTYGQILVGILGLIFLGKAANQFYLVFSDDFKKRVDESKINNAVRGLVIKAGIVGFMARGIVIVIIAFLTFKAAVNANSSEAGGTQDAFMFLQNKFGVIIFLTVALGMILYGFFMFVRARYLNINLT